MTLRYATKSIQISGVNFYDVRVLVALTSRFWRLKIGVPNFIKTPEGGVLFYFYLCYNGSLNEVCKEKLHLK